MKTLEEKRKAKSLVYYERKKKLLVSQREGVGSWEMYRVATALPFSPPVGHQGEGRSQYCTEDGQSLTRTG